MRGLRSDLSLPVKARNRPGGSPSRAAASASWPLPRPAERARSTWRRTSGVDAGPLDDWPLSWLIRGVTRGTMDVQRSSSKATAQRLTVSVSASAAPVAAALGVPPNPTAIPAPGQPASPCAEAVSRLSPPQSAG